MIDKYRKYGHHINLMVMFNCRCNKTIFSHEDTGGAIYPSGAYRRVYGRVDKRECFWASLMVHVTLWDASEKNQANPKILQKTYKYEEPFKEKEPQELTKAMSMAMKKFLQELIWDLYQFTGGSI